MYFSKLLEKLVEICVEDADHPERFSKHEEEINYDAYAVTYTDHSFNCNAD